MAEQLFGYEDEQGEMTMDRVDEREVQYAGRLDFGVGTIDATTVGQEEALQVAWVAQARLVPVDYYGLPGTCMDGREDVEAEDGTPLLVRPKVIGGPLMLAWTVAENARMGIVAEARDKGASPLERLEIVANRLVEAGFQLGGHIECGAIRGAGPVQGTQEQFAEQLVGLAGGEARELWLARKTLSLDDLRNNSVALRQDITKQGEAWNEAAVLDIIRKTSGGRGVARLHSDEAHPNHSHEERILLRNRRHGVSPDKNAVIAEAGQGFMQDVAYAVALTEAIAQTDKERDSGLLVGEIYPLAGVATLGKGQHVIDLPAAA